MTNEKIDKILKDWRNGVSIATIAKKMNVTYGMIHYQLKKLGLKG